MKKLELYSTASCAKKITLKVTHKHDYISVMYTVTNIIPTIKLTSKLKLTFTYFDFALLSPTCSQEASQHTHVTEYNTIKVQVVEMHVKTGKSESAI